MVKRYFQIYTPSKWRIPNSNPEFLDAKTYAYVAAVPPRACTNHVFGVLWLAVFLAAKG